MARRPADDDAPRLPRGGTFKLSVPELVRIAMVATALVALLVLQRPCADSLSKFVLSFDGTDAGVGDAGAIDPGATAAPVGVHLRTDMTPAELEAAIAAARGIAAGDAGPNGPVDARDTRDAAP